MQKAIEVQGDVALRPATLPDGAKRIEHRPLALGEVSGHAHVVEACGKDTGAYDLFQDPATGKTFVAVGGDGATLRHIRLHTGEQADHQSIALAPNTTYEVILQNEYNPEAGAFERVLD
jgi:hypothetical protein